MAPAPAPADRGATERPASAGLHHRRRRGRRPFHAAPSPWRDFPAREPAIWYPPSMGGGDRGDDLAHALPAGHNDHDVQLRVPGDEVRQRRLSAPRGPAMRAVPPRAVENAVSVGRCEVRTGAWRTPGARRCCAGAPRVGAPQRIVAPPRPRRTGPWPRAEPPPTGKGPRQDRRGAPSTGDDHRGEGHREDRRDPGTVARRHGEHRQSDAGRGLLSPNELLWGAGRPGPGARLRGPRPWPRPSVAGRSSSGTQPRTARSCARSRLRTAAASSSARVPPDMAARGASAPCARPVGFRARPPARRRDAAPECPQPRWLDCG
jgi:hypothetical protein